MKTSFTFPAFWVFLLGLFLAFASPAFAESHSMVNDALDLVHKAWNPEGNPPSDAQREKWLHQALKLLRHAPPASYDGHKKKAVEYIESALYEMKHGDPDHKVTNYLQDADSQLRTGLSDAS